jgi:hypothetical protein
MIIVSSGTGTVTNINTTAPLSGGPITTSGTITTAMATNKLIGRSTAGTGVMEEITVGTGLSLTGGTLSSTGGATAAGNTNEIQFNSGGAFAASSNLDWIIADNRLLLGSENTADINSRMVVIGKGISTNNTFVVHNSTGTNNALVVRDDTRVGIATATPASTLSIGTIHNFSITGSGGVSIFGSRLDQNSNTIWNLDNRTSGANSEVVILLRSTDEGTTLSHTSPLYTNNFNGSEGRAGVLYTKLQNANAGKQKFAISNTSSAATNKFEWISAVVALGGTLSTGFGTTTPIMTLVGNGNLLLGTVTDVATSILTINSTTKGVLLPRLTTTEINNIVSPATGLTVYNTTINTLCFYNGSSWQKCSHANL